MMRPLARVLGALALFLFIPSLGHAQPDAKSPVIVIPGTLGSKLCSRATGQVVWGDKWSLSRVPEIALPVAYNPDGLPHLACGLIDTVNILGPLQAHQYDDLITTLKSMGYEVDRNLFVFAYDWRLSNRDIARQFAAFIKQKVPSGKVDIVAHSMGGIVAKVWMAEHGGASRVSTFVTMGTPFQGSADTFKTLDEGLGFWKNLLAHGVGNIRETALTWPSLYELMPTYGRCCGFRSNPSIDPAYFDPFMTAPWAKFGWLPANFRTKERQEWLKQTLSTAKAIGETNVPPGPKIVRIVNGLIPTAWRIEFDAADGRVLKYINQPGDGTVYEYSAANGQLPDARPALTRHARIFADDASRQTLRWVLTKGPEPTKGVIPGIKASLRAANGALIQLSSASAEIVPQILDPEQSGEFVVELTGAEELASANLTNISAFREGFDKPLSLLRSEPVRVSQNTAVLKLVFALTAPKEPGAFSVTANLPAVAELPDIGLVVPK